MRIYTNFKEAINETHRDLAEMGIRVHPATMQDKYVADDDSFETLELQNYGYTVLGAVESIGQLSPNQPWADAEFEERISHDYINPGKAWELRPEVWTEFLHGGPVFGKFAYTYNERMRIKLDRIIQELKHNPDSRQCYLPIFSPDDVQWIGGAQNRIPCSLGYLFQVRRGRLNMTYYMRSCDFITHFQNDVYLAVKLMDYVAQKIDRMPGDFTHFMNSLHIYKKDARGVF
jgi:thymidylate synthase